MSQHCTEKALWFGHGLQPFLMVAIQAVEYFRTFSGNMASLPAANDTSGAVEQTEVVIQAEMVLGVLDQASDRNQPGRLGLVIAI